MKKKIENRGGKRPGTGRPKGAETTSMCIRVPKNLYIEVKKKYPNRGDLTKAVVEWMNSLVKN